MNFSSGYLKSSSSLYFTPHFCTTCVWFVKNVYEKPKKKNNSTNFFYAIFYRIKMTRVWERVYTWFWRFYRADTDVYDLFKRVFVYFILFWKLLRHFGPLVYFNYLQKYTRPRQWCGFSFMSMCDVLKFNTRRHISHQYKATNTPAHTHINTSKQGHTVHRTVIFIRFPSLPKRPIDWTIRTPTASCKWRNETEHE